MYNKLMPCLLALSGKLVKQRGKLTETVRVFNMSDS